MPAILSILPKLLHGPHRYAPQWKSPDIPSITIGVDVAGEDVNLPLLGAGTWQYNDTIAYESVCKAFRQGYTFVDTASNYKNQKGVGRAIKDCWTRDRKDLFVMTKIPGGLGSAEALSAAQENLEDLQLEYVDHLMTHFPADFDVTPSRSSREARQEEWLVLESIYYDGKARSIGMSHYCPSHIDDVLDIASVQPAINQVEYHVGSGDVDHVIEKCKETGITFMSFSPLCGPCEYAPEDSLVHGKIVSEIAENYANVSGSQVALRFIVQQALSEKSSRTDNRSYIGGVIPKSNNVDHIRSNMDIFSFQLNQEDMEKLRNTQRPAGEGGDCEVP